jgi:TonB-dependent SusC/RagA subfamily outer membrane receptor
VYKVNAATAEQFIRKQTINLNSFLESTSFTILKKDNATTSSLPNGNYIFISVDNNFVVAEHQNVSNLYVYTVNNRKRVQLLIIDKNGNFIETAKVWVNDKPAPYNPSSKSYWVNQKDPEDARVKIYTNSDTLYAEIWAEDELYRTVLAQRWNNFKNSKFIKILKWPVWKIGNVFRDKSPLSEGSQGMMVFNQPKYKKTDTVKLKAYLYDRKLKMSRQKVDVFLSYDGRDSRQPILIKNIAPTSPGSYQLTFPLSDTLPSNTSYRVFFENRKGKMLINSYFKVEDYLLDDITEYNFRSNELTYYPGDTMHFYASAKDANGLSVLDANATLTLMVNNITRFYKDSIYVPDTLFIQNKKLEADGDTKFDFAPVNLKDASVNIIAKLQFKNSNNEVQEKELNISFASAKKELTADITNDTVTATYRENGAMVHAEGIVVGENQWNDTLKISYPYKAKVNPMAESYSFYVVQNGKITDSATAAPTSYSIYLEPINNGDTLGFNVNNPYAIPVTYSVFDGNKIIGSGQSNEQQVKWRLASANKNRIYRVLWQYRWAGEEERQEQNIGIHYKALNIDVKSNSTVFPGQKDTITINVKDYKDNAAENINLTAFAYNNQFARDIRVPQPLNLKKYTVRPSISRDTYEEYNGPTAYSRFPIASYPEWQKKFGLDSMKYFQMLLPRNGFVDMPTPITELLPQVSIHAVQNGVWQPANMLYINRELVYYNGVTEAMKDVYQVPVGLTQIGIRLRDRYIEIDSIYLQSFYKHDLVVDIDHLPSNAKVVKMPPYYTSSEKIILENNIMRLREPAYSNNNSYLWQGTKTVHINDGFDHVLGPFRQRDSLHYFKPRDFDIHFVFEPGYQYEFSKKIARLEKKPLFPYNFKYYLKATASNWSFGDTLTEHPEIRYDEPAAEPYLKLSPESKLKDVEGKLFFTIHQDSVIKYVVLYPAGDPDKKLVFDGNKRVIEHLTPGEYTLLLVDKFWRTLEIPRITLVANKTLCLHTDHVLFNSGNSLLWKWWNEKEEGVVIDSTSTPKLRAMDTISAPFGNATITGKVTDARGGLPIAGVTVIIKGTKTGAYTDTAGIFYIRNIKSGTYTIGVHSVGYESKELGTSVGDGGIANIQIQLKEQTANMQEVVVTAYGLTTRKNTVAYFATPVFQRSALPMLQGKVQGISIQKDEELSGNILPRGFSSTHSTQLLYVIDGILYDELPANLSANTIASYSVLNEAAAVAVYGSRAANGAIVITTNNGGATRKRFSDYAFWQPELFTDKNGEAKFVVEYPDNITGWQLFVLGMDKKLRAGKAVKFINSYKPVWAELNLPRFLIESDSTEIVGKTVNYSNDTYDLQASFTVNGNKSGEQQISIKSNESVIRKYNISTSSADTLKASFNITSSTGFNDGEEQRIPVFKKGLMQTDGKFWILNKDTTVHFVAPVQSGTIEIYAQNNTLEVLLNEIDGLKKYPYACNEQTASKLRGLFMEKEIRKALQQKFTEQRSIELLLSKILKGQSYDGGWSWWEGGKSNINVTNYVLNALLPLRTDANVETHIRNGLLYLANQAADLNRADLLTTMLTMIRAKHEMRYDGWLATMKFDSLTTHEQWQWVLVSRFSKVPYADELKKLINKGTKGMLGELHWGDENYRWYSNEVATTVLAFEVLMGEPNMKAQLDDIVQYFLAMRTGGYWRNTVESASIVSAMLPYVLKENSDFNKPGTLNITGDTTFAITKYPFKVRVKNRAIRALEVQKIGGGLTYFTIFQNHWNSDPSPLSKHFDVKTKFEKNGRSVSSLTSGERVMMVVDIKTEKEAEYMMMEVPIPAGCVYGKNENTSDGLHRELLKDKVVLFSERLPKGNHRFTIELEARYNGSYTLNPAKASLMYFPTFYGRNGVGSVRVKSN